MRVIFLLNPNVPQRTLSDIRDNETYIIRKLADGNCWMVENLRLGSPSMSYNLDSATSDLSEGRTFTLPKAQTTGFTNTANNNQVGERNPSYGNGAYYSWYAATAGTGTTDLSSGEAAGSVCPKDWGLPRHTSEKSYENIIVNVYGIPNSAAGISRLKSAPLSLLRTGRYDESGFYGDSGGRYWTTSAYNATAAYNLLFYDSEYRVKDDGSKNMGRQIRCVAR